MASAADMAPDAMIKQLSDEVLSTLKTDQSIRGGDVSKITSYVDSVVMPNVDFRRMMASAVGPKWRTATASQQQQLQDEFKKLMVNTYAGALHQAALQAGGSATLFRAAGADAASAGGHFDPKTAADAATAALGKIQARLRHTFDPAGIFNPARASALG